jgi:hypothetical protein
LFARGGGRGGGLLLYWGGEGALGGILGCGIETIPSIISSSSSALNCACIALSLASAALAPSAGVYPEASPDVPCDVPLDVPSGVRLLARMASSTIFDTFMLWKLVAVSTNAFGMLARIDTENRRVDEVILHIFDVRYIIYLF